jgi:RNA polymerase sigma factor (sigma-70 family)
MYDEDEEILSYLPNVHVAARVFCRKTGGRVDYEDLCSVGHIALIQAVRNYNASLGGSFSAYAFTRIRGAMLDFLRHEDPLSRTERKKQGPSFRAKVNFETDPKEGLTVEQLVSPFPDQYIDLLHRELLDALYTYPTKECWRQMMIFKFVYDKTHLEIGKPLKLSESRISQIMATELAKLRDYIQRPDDEIGRHTDLKSRRSNP